MWKKLTVSIMVLAAVLGILSWLGLPPFMELARSAEMTADQLRTLVVCLSAAIFLGTWAWLKWPQWKQRPQRKPEEPEQLICPLNTSQLCNLVKEETTLGADKKLAALLDTWLHVNGAVFNVWNRGDHFVTVELDCHDDPGISLLFDLKYRNHLEPLKKGDLFRAKGQLYGVSGDIVTLKNCIPEDVQGL